MKELQWLLGVPVMAEAFRRRRQSRRRHSMTALLALFLSQVRFPSLLVHLLHRFSIDINMREHTLTEQL